MKAKEFIKQNWLEIIGSVLGILVVVSMITAVVLLTRKPSTDIQESVIIDSYGHQWMTFDNGEQFDVEHSPQCTICYGPIADEDEDYIDYE